MSKGFNSVIFDFDSIVDKELSIIRFLREEYRDIAIPWYDKSVVNCSTESELKFKRQFAKEDLFKSIIQDQSMKTNSDKLLNLLFERDQKEIFDKDYAFTTNMISLITAYKKVGNGIIKTAVRCDNEEQKSYIKKIINNDIIVEMCPRNKVDMGKYGRLIVGHYSSALEYVFNEPKSILLLNFRENFDSKDGTLLKPELLINLGDIHDIEIISAFIEDPNIKG